MYGRLVFFCINYVLVAGNSNIAPGGSVSFVAGNSNLQNGGQVSVTSGASSIKSSGTVSIDTSSGVTSGAVKLPPTRIYLQRIY